MIKAERRVLKELGFCVHVKHPHKVRPTLICCTLGQEHTFHAIMQILSQRIASCSSAKSLEQVIFIMFTQICGIKSGQKHMCEWTVSICTPLRSHWMKLRFTRTRYSNAIMDIKCRATLRVLRIAQLCARRSGTQNTKYVWAFNVHYCVTVTCSRKPLTTPRSNEIMDVNGAGILCVFRTVEQYAEKT